MTQTVLTSGRVIKSLTPVGVAITGVIIFLEWSGVTEKYIAHPIRLRHAVKNRWKSQNKLIDAINSGRTHNIENTRRSLSENYFAERASIMEQSYSMLYAMKMH